MKPVTDAGDASWSEREEKDRYDAELDLAEQARREEARERVWDVIDNNDPHPVDLSEDDFDHLSRERMEEDDRRARDEDRPTNTLSERIDISTPGTGSSGEIARLNAELRRRDQLPPGYYDDPIRVATDTPIGGAAPQPGGGAITPPATGSRVRPDAMQTARERAIARPPAGETSDLADRLAAHFVERGLLDAGLAEGLEAAAGGERAARRAIRESIRRTRFPLSTEPDELLAAWDRYARDAGMTAAAAATTHNPTVVTRQPNDRGGTDYAIIVGGSITPNGPEPVTGAGDRTFESVTASGTGDVLEQDDTTEATATTDPPLGPNDRSVVVNVAFGIIGNAAADITGTLGATQDDQIIDLAGTAAAGTGARGILSIGAPTIDNASVLGEPTITASPPAEQTIEGSGATLRVTARPTDTDWHGGRSAGGEGVMTSRVDRLDEARKHLAREGTEPIIALAHRFLSDPPAGTSDHVLNRVDANARVVAAALTDPEPNAIVVEAAIATLLEHLAESVSVGSTVAAELESLDVPAELAAAIGDRLDEAVDLASKLGADDEATDVSQANAVLAKLDEAAEGVEAALPAAAGITDEERDARLAEADLKGQERFLTEHKPRLKADAIRMVIKGTPVLVGSGLTGIAWATGNLRMAGVTAVLTAIGRVIQAAFKPG